MSPLHFVLRSLRQHLLSTVITAASIALAGGLLMAVWVVREQSHRAFTQNNAGFDAVLGARGLKLQLVLNSVFHVEESPGNIQWQDYQEIKSRPSVETAVAIAVGDSYRGYRLVGVTTNLFGDFEYAPGKRYQVQPPGRFFNQELREAVVGSFVAERLGLKYGDSFHPFHGLNGGEHEAHAETYVVVGILKPSNTPADRVIWIPLEGIQKMDGHDARTAEDLSAVLVKLRGSGQAGFQLDLLYNKQGNRLTFAWPIGRIMAQMFDKVSWFDRILEMVTYLVALVASGSILASLYTSMNERRRDLAILRALGARQSTVFGLIVLEAAAIAALGMVASFGVYAAITLPAAAVMRAQTGVVLEPWAFSPVWIWAPTALIALGALAGLAPAFKAYRNPVAENLLPIS